MRISAAVLAAGQGTRMGMNKALLSWEGSTLLARAVNTIRQSEVVSEIKVVVGAMKGKVSLEAAKLGAGVVENPDFASGLMSSLQAGIRTLSPEIEAVMVVLVDQPLVSVETLRAVARDFDEPYSLARPFFDGKPGHPCLISRKHFAEILAQPSRDEGASFLFRKYSGQVRQHDADPGVVFDLDTLADFHRSSHAPSVS